MGIDARNAREVEELLRAGKRDGDGYVDLSALNLDGVDLSNPDLLRVRFSSESARRSLRLTSFSGSALRTYLFQWQRSRMSDSRSHDHAGQRFSIRRICYDLPLRGPRWRIPISIGASSSGNVFEEATIRNVSFHLADLSGSDLRWSNFESDEALMAASPAALGRLLKEHPDRLRHTFEIQTGRSYRDAIGIYRHLTGIWHESGRYNDEAKAYVRAKRFELRDAWAHLTGQLPHRARTTERGAALRTVIGHSIALLVCRFGESLADHCLDGCPHPGDCA